MNRLMTIMISIVHLSTLMNVSAAQWQTSLLQPPSASLSLPAPPSATLPELNNFDFLLEDRANDSLAQQQELLAPARIARSQFVHFDFTNSGSWETLSDGSRVWRLRIVSPGATDLYLVYDAWRLVKPCELYLYNDDHSVVLGPYTYLDNWGNSNITPLTDGEAVTLEYFVPAGVEDFGELSISDVLHGYRHFFHRAEREREQLDGFGESLDCMVNVACYPEYATEKNSVGLIIDPQGGTCTGTLLNNVPQNGDPLFLTAFHCANANIPNWVFYFNYESPQCDPNENGSMSHVIRNATRLMSFVESDNALLRLSRSRPSTTFIPYYSAWSRLDIAPLSTHVIHHPRADVKKIQNDSTAAWSSAFNGLYPNSHWRLIGQIGTAEPGASGAPLFDQNDRVVGQLHGGTSNCGPEQMIVCGKMSYAWEGGGTQDTRLRDWLDPDNTEIDFKDGYQPVSPPNDTCGANVPQITALPAAFTGNTTFAQNNSTVNCSTGTNTGGDVLFTVELPCPAQVTVSTCGSSFDSQLLIYRTTQFGGCSQTGTLIACNDDFCGDQSQLTFSAAVGETYTVVLDGYGSASGEYAINFTGVPCTSLDAPVGLTINRVSTTEAVKLQWYPVPGASSYSIYRSDVNVTPCDSSGNLLAATPDTFYVHQGALSLTTSSSYYCVTAAP